MRLIRNIIESSVVMTLFLIMKEYRLKSKFVYVVFCWFLFYINMYSGWWLTQFIEDLYKDHFCIDPRALEINPDLLNAEVEGVYAILWYICWYAAIPVLVFFESRLMNPFKKAWRGIVHYISYIILVGSGIVAEVYILCRNSYDVIHCAFIDNIYITSVFAILIVVSLIQEKKKICLWLHNVGKALDDR